MVVINTCSLLAEWAAVIGCKSRGLKDGERSISLTFRTVINDIAGASYISPSSRITGTAAMGMLRYNYSRGKNPEFEEIIAGRFI